MSLLGRVVSRLVMAGGVVNGRAGVDCDGLVDDGLVDDFVMGLVVSHGVLEVMLLSLVLVSGVLRGDLGGVVRVEVNLRVSVMGLLMDLVLGDVVLLLGNVGSLVMDVLMNWSVMVNGSGVVMSGLVVDGHLVAMNGHVIVDDRDVVSVAGSVTFGVKGLLGSLEVGGLVVARKLMMSVGVLVGMSSLVTGELVVRMDGFAEVSVADGVNGSDSFDNLMDRGRVMSVLLVMNGTVVLTFVLGVSVVGRVSTMMGGGVVVVLVVLGGSEGGNSGDGERSHNDGEVVVQNFNYYNPIHISFPT